MITGIRSFNLERKDVLAIGPKSEERFIFDIPFIGGNHYGHKNVRWERLIRIHMQA